MTVADGDIFATKVISEFTHVILLLQIQLPLADDAVLSSCHDSLPIGIICLIEVLLDACILSLYPFVNVSKARRTLSYL